MADGMFVLWVSVDYLDFSLGVFEDLESEVVFFSGCIAESVFNNVCHEFVFISSDDVASKEFIHEGGIGGSEKGSDGKFHFFVFNL